MNILIYTKEDCPYCVKAKEFLTKHNLPYVEKYVNKATGLNLDDFYRDCPGEKTVPQIIVDGKLLKGGYTGLIVSGIEKYVPLLNASPEQ